MIDKIVIVEDEKLNADRLKRLIHTIRPDACVLAVLDSVSDAVVWFSKNGMPDLVMMDIRLSDGVSFDIFERVKIDCFIIFTTAYDEYAVQAFKYNSVDYLLKPIEQEELEVAFRKTEMYNSINTNHLSIERLLHYIQPKEYRTRFLLPFRDGYKTVLVSDVKCIYVELKAIKARLRNGTDILLSQSMEELEQQLDPRLFFRANRQFIVHIDAVQQVVNYFNGKLKVILNGIDMEVIVSREKAIVFKEWLDS
ncbi:LytR/AlgR family response regulator transcription factor [Sphingobacterium spiritivorum]|uniref:LytR/AlgR family response regulator transcription factor n=1 Tax=Sphingobacterium TaxID=28453 RepID=UPI0025D9603E|nr:MULTISPECIES: LytTR family DNA-binding domain-containing protein [unclassified Sphingobacterium]